MILIWILSKSYVHRLYIKDGNSHRAEHFSHCHLVFFNYYFPYTFYDLRVTTLHTHPVTNCQSQDGLTLNQYIYLNWEHAVINETTDLIHKFTKKKVLIEVFAWALVIFSAGHETDGKSILNKFLWRASAWLWSWKPFGFLLSSTAQPVWKAKEVCSKLISVHSSLSAFVDTAWNMRNEKSWLGFLLTKPDIPTNCPKFQEAKSAD